jgi:hypothetical protein
VRATSVKAKVRKFAAKYLISDSLAVTDGKMYFQALIRKFWEVE